MRRDITQSGIGRNIGECFFNVLHGLAIPFDGKSLAATFPTSDVR
jgi:hypothetical protein